MRKKEREELLRMLEEMEKNDKDIMRLSKEMKKINEKINLNREKLVHELKNLRC